MSDYRVRRFLAPDKIERALLLNDENEPLFWPSVYVAEAYRTVGRSAHTIEKVLRAIAMAERWGDSLGRSLDSFLLTGPFLSIEQAGQLAAFLKLPLSAQRTQVASQQPGSNVILLGPKRMKRRALRSAPTSEASDRGVPDEEAASRIGFVASYLQWHMTRRVAHASRSGSNTDDLVTGASLAISKLRSLAPTVADRGDDEVHLEAMDKDAEDRIEAALKPGSPNNPFKSPFIQHRNYLIWRLFYDGGPRRGEILRAGVRDVNFGARKFAITRSKTLPRTIGISVITAKAYSDFLDIWADVVPLSKQKAGLLLVSEKGIPLSGRAIARIFVTIRETVTEIPDWLTPHTMRRNWNDRLSRWNDKQPADKAMTPQKERQVRIRIMGWSNKTKMTNKYDKRHIREASGNIAEQMSNDLKYGDGSIGSSKERKS